MPARPIGPRAPSRSNSGSNRPSPLSPTGEPPFAPAAAMRGSRPLSHPNQPSHRSRNSTASTASTTSLSSEELLMPPTTYTQHAPHPRFMYGPAHAPGQPIRSMRTTRSFSAASVVPSGRQMRERSTSGSSTATVASIASVTSTMSSNPATAESTHKPKPQAPEAYLRLHQPEVSRPCACRICERERRRSA